jgi:hypothetical protein
VNYHKLKSGQSLTSNNLSAPAPADMISPSKTREGMMVSEEQLMNIPEQQEMIIS